jgi:hypothetical protein
MENMIKLNLRSDNEKAAADNLPNPQDKEPESPAMHSKRLNRLLKKVGHHASASPSKSGIFTK